MVIPNLMEFIDKLKIYAGYEFDTNVGILNFFGFIATLLVIKFDAIINYIFKFLEFIVYFICLLFRIEGGPKEPYKKEEGKKGDSWQYLILFGMLIICICFVKSVKNTI